MAREDLWRGGSLSGDDLYGDRENLRRYRDFARDEHRRIAADDERHQQGGRPRADSLTEHDRFEEDLTGGQFRPNRRHATEGGYAYGSFGGVTPEGRPLEYRYPHEMPPARHRGQGPRGYQRSDQRIYEDVCERLTEDDRIDASEVDVQVTDGEVTLSGHVRGRNAKRRASDVAEYVRGVKHVYNAIHVSDDQTWPPGRVPAR